MKSVKSGVVVLTGAGGGLGTNLATYFLEQGYQKLALVGRGRIEGLAELLVRADLDPERHIFQAELSDPENPLPQNLKEDILNLSIFVDKRLFEVLAFPEKEKLSIVIDIDFNIAAGLRTTPEQ